MLSKLNRALIAMSVIAGAHVSAAQAVTTFVDWSSFTASTSPGAGNGTAVGTLQFGPTTVNVSYAGDIYSGGGLTTVVNNSSGQYSNGSIFSPGVALTDNISNDGGSNKVHTITFDHFVVDPRFHVRSMGAPGNTVDWVFDRDFSVLSGSILRAGPNILRGTESNGTIQFTGSFSSLSWTTPIFENTTGFQFSVEAAGAPVSAPMPEPASLLLLTLGSLLVGRRRRMSAES